MTGLVVPTVRASGSRRRALDDAPVDDPPLRSGPPESVRSAVAEAVRSWLPRLAAVDDLTGDALARWRELVAAGRTDLVVGRLVEGHVDATCIAAEAGHALVPGAAYGVWASQSGRTGLTATTDGDGWQVAGLMRFCSGAHLLDRALVTARAPDDRLLLLDLDLTLAGIQPLPDTWPAVGMDASDSGDVRVQAVRVGSGCLVGEPGWYLDRPGFPIGGIGVAAVWWGGARGLLDATADGLRRFVVDEHQYAHLGALACGFAATAALLEQTADLLPSLDRAGLDRRALLCRSAVDALVQDTLVRVPRITGPVPASHDPAVAHRLADLPVYVRQQHAERDLAELGRVELERSRPEHGPAGGTR